MCLCRELNWVAATMRATGKACELCKQAASLYCDADSAFLCYSCDAAVHQANFLVARHFRRSLCSKCASLSPNAISGARISPHNALCRSCSMNNCSDDPDSSSSSWSASSVCISSVKSAVPAVKNIRPDCNRKADAIGASSSVTETSGRNVNSSAERVSSRTRAPRSRCTEAKVEGIIESWCKRLGLEFDSSTALVSNVMAFCISSTKLTVLPLRISLAAAFWLGLRLSHGESMATWHNLRRLGKVAGVPSKLILGAAAKLSPSGRGTRPHPDLQEGWAEC